MDCSEFIDRFSDFFDGVGDSAFMREAEAHVSRCRSCKRYLDVIDTGAELFRSAPDVKVSGDFYPRLQHRLFHLEDADALARGSTGSATTAATILGMAVLLTMIAWSPLMRSDAPEVELSPIVVSRPPSSPLGLRPAPVSLSSSVAAPSFSTAATFESGNPALWERSNLLLFRHSPLSERYAPRAVLRTGFD